MRTLAIQLRWTSAPSADPSPLDPKSASPDAWDYYADAKNGFVLYYPRGWAQCRFSAYVAGEVGSFAIRPKCGPPYPAAVAVAVGVIRYPRENWEELLAYHGPTKFKGRPAVRYGSYDFPPFYTEGAWGESIRVLLAEDDSELSNVLVLSFSVHAHGEEQNRLRKLWSSILERVTFESEDS